MDQLQLEHLTAEIKIAPEHIVREYYEMVILQAISEAKFSKNLMFYGGTALRLAYNGIRFSEDLDFLMLKKITADELKAVLEKTCATYPILQLVEVKDKRNTLFGLVKFKHPSLKHPRQIKIEISKKSPKNKQRIMSELRLLSSPCSNFSPLLSTITLSSLEKAKIDAIKDRMEPRDWLDLWLTANALHKNFTLPTDFPFEKGEFKRELKRFLPKNRWNIIDEILKNA